MWLGEFLLENFTGDLEYHPRRAALYLGLGVAAPYFWAFSSPKRRFTAIPLAFSLGSLPLVVKEIFLLRKSSEGIILSEQNVYESSNRSNRKGLPSLPCQIAQIVRDFGAGGILLWPLLRYGKALDNSWDSVSSSRIPDQVHGDRCTDAALLPLIPTGVPPAAPVWVISVETGKSGRLMWDGWSLS